MGVRKYKYYFTKPKSEITKDILMCLLAAGAICIAGNSPYFVRNILKEFKKWRKYSKKKISDTFSNLKRQGLIKIKNENHQIYITLTKEGKKKAGFMQIDNLKIKQHPKWTGEWWMVIFDIAQDKKLHREALRGKLKELGFYPLQKSIWIYPFDCRAEIELLKDFFRLSENEVRLIVTKNIGDDKKFQKLFKLK